MTKKSISLFVILLCCILFICGCATIEYQTVVDDTGHIMNKVTIELDKQKLLTKISENSFNTLKADIRSDLDDEIRIANNKITNLRLAGDITYGDEITAVVSEWRENDGIWSIFIQYDFKDNSYLEKFRMSSGEEPEKTIVSDMFISKLIQTTDNVFVDIDTSDYFTYYSGKYAQFDIGDVNLVQIYGTTDNRLKTNADYCEKIKGINYHYWDIDSQNAGYKSMKLSYYYVTAVGTGWYIVALAVSVALSIILLTICLFKRAPKYIEKINYLEDDDE